MENYRFLGFADPFSSVSHLLGLFLAIVGGVLLVRKGRGNAARVTSLLVFTITMVFLFSMSGVYHLLDRQSVARSVFQRLDHAGIWAMIAGTFTPMLIILFRGPWRWGKLTLIWVFAITGLVLEFVFFTTFPEWLALTLFLGLGWLGAFSMVRFKRQFVGDTSFRLLLGGAVAYSVGAAIDFARWPILVPHVLGSHEIFHVFVLLGAFLHWMFIYHWADHPVQNTIIFTVRLFPEGNAIAEAVSERVEVSAGSLAELKILIKRSVRAKYHKSIQPVIVLKYSNEEILA